MVRELPTLKLRAAIYCRVSTDEQARHGFSLEAQQESCMRYIKDFGHDLFKIYVDDGYSAKNMNRPALQEMLEDIRNKQIDIIIIWRLDRLTRRALDGLRMVDELFTKHGVSFATITERHDLTTAQGRWMFTVSLANAQNERELIGERVSFGQAKKAANGRRVSLGAVYGYDKVNGKLVINETEANIVKQIFNWYVYKGWGYGKIASQLNADEVPAKKTQWVHSTIKGILYNVTYIGKNAWTPKNADTIVNDGEHDAILEVDLFSLAQDRLKRRGGLEMSRSSYHFPFSSIVKCGTCGASYHANKTKKASDTNSYVNYRCANRKPGKCKEPDIAEIKLQKLFFEYFRNLTLEVQEITPPLSDDQVKIMQKEKSRIEREIKKFENRKNNLLDDLGDKIITRDEYRGKVEEINSRLSKLQEEMNIMEPPEAAAASQTPEQVVGIVQNLEGDWKYMENEQRKFLIQMIFKRIVITKELNEWKIKEVEPT
jgi:site-specific DNA recombinase